MDEDFSQKALVALHRMNCPITIDDNFYTINVAVKKNINNLYYFQCPFCVTKRKRNNEPYVNSKPVIHIHGEELGTRFPHCDERTLEYYDLPYFEFNLVDKTSFVEYKHTFKKS